MQPCSRGPHLWPALTSQVKGLRDRGAYCEMKIHRVGLNTEQFHLNKTLRWNVLKERTAESLHRDKDMTSSDIWTLRHRLVSWFAAEQKQNWSVQFKHNHPIIMTHLSTFYPRHSFVLQCSSEKQSNIFHSKAQKISAVQQLSTLWRKHN